MPRKPREPTRKEIDDFKTKGDLIAGRIGPTEHEHINIDAVVDRTITEMGFDPGADYAAYLKFDQAKCATARRL
jgi:hypothetical protein